MWNSLPDNVILANNVNHKMVLFSLRTVLISTGKCMILYSIIAPTLLKPEVWHELIRIVKINWFKWHNVFHKDVDIEAVACVHNLQYRFSTDKRFLVRQINGFIYVMIFGVQWRWRSLCCNLLSSYFLLWGDVDLRTFILRNIRVEILKLSSA